MIPIPDIRERNDRPKDRQPKHQVTSTVQRQMVQKFVKELNDSAKQPDRSDSAECTATEQVETTAREIVHEAIQFPRRVLQRPDTKESTDSSTETRPPHTPKPTHQRADAPRTRPEPQHPQSTPAAVPQEQARRAYVQQTAKTATPAPPITSEQPQHTTVTVPSAENAPRQRTEDVRTRPDPKQPQSASAPTPQEQARRVYVQQAAKEGAPAPSIMPEQPRERHVVRSAPLTENTPRQRTEDVRTHSAPKQRQSAPTAQEQGRRSYVRQEKKSRAEKASAWDDFHTEKSEIRLTEDIPEHELPHIREKPTITELRGEPRPEPTPENASNVQHIKQTGTWTPRGTEPYSRGIEQSIRERSAVTQAHDLPPVPQEQARQVFVEKQAQLSQNPSIKSIYPSEPTVPIPPQPPVSDAPATTQKRQPITVGSANPASPMPQTAHPPTPAQTPPAEQLPAIRGKPKPNAAPREKSRRGVDIRTRDTEQISAPTAQPKTPVSKIDVEVKSMVFCLRSQP